MNCKEYLDVQNSYIDGMVDAETRAQIEAHLAECPACAKVHAEMKTIIKTLQEGTEIDVPENLAAEILTAVKANQEKVVPFKLPKFLKSWQFYSSLAACFFLVFTMNQRGNVIVSRSNQIQSYTTMPARPEKYAYPVMPAMLPAYMEENEAEDEADVPEKSPVPAASEIRIPTVPADSARAVQHGVSFADIQSTAAPKEPVKTPAPTAKPTPTPTAKPKPTPTAKPKPTAAPAKPYSTLGSLVKRSITFVVDSEKARAVFLENKDSGEAAVRRALIDAGYDFSTRESIAEEYAPQYNALVKEANALAERIAKGETHLSTQLTEKKQQMLSLKNTCKTPVLYVAYQ